MQDFLVQFWSLSLVKKGMTVKKLTIKISTLGGPGGPDPLGWPPEHTEHRKEH